MKKQKSVYLLGGIFLARSKHTVEQKLTVLQLLADGEYTLEEICRIYELTDTTLYRWQVKYKAEGLEGLKESKTRKPYSKELKVAAVQDYTRYGLTINEVLAKYQISSDSVLYRWIRKYTSHSELKDSGKGMSKTMTKGRPTTVEERIEIAQYCLNNQRNYQATAEKYGVSYQQVYSWVKKLEASGEEALKDRRGRTKPQMELTEEEKMKLRIQQMERENERLRAENLFLKKLEEIERRR